MNCSHVNTCMLYGSRKILDIDDLREVNLMKKCGNELNSSRNVDIGSLPPCKCSLLRHVRRANYQVGIWRRAHLPKPDIPDPVQGHGWQIVNGIIEPIWFEGDPIPTLLADILEAQREKEDKNDSSDDSEESSDELEADSDSSDDL